MKEILEVLENDGRASCEKIATMLGMGVDEVKNSIEKLEKDGAIIKYKTIIDWEKVEEEKVFAFIDVKVTPERDKGFDAIASRIAQYPEVHSLYLMSGAYDFAVVVEGKSMKDIAYFVAERLAIIENVTSTTTHFILKKYKVDGIILEKQEDTRIALMP
ncbi:TPA: AsnC family transcriptional regulator [bacterium]|nr:AsnC family transcriptional regulator [bacterium]